MLLSDPWASFYKSCSKFYRIIKKAREHQGDSCRLIIVDFRHTRSVKRGFIMRSETIKQRTYSNSHINSTDFSRDFNMSPELIEKLNDRIKSIYE